MSWHGGKTVFFGWFIGFLRALAPFVAGSSRVPYRQFLPYNILGGLLWSLSCIALGYSLEGGAPWTKPVAVGRERRIPFRLQHL